MQHFNSARALTTLVIVPAFISLAPGSASKIPDKPTEAQQAHYGKTAGERVGAAGDIGTDLGSTLASPDAVTNDHVQAGVNESLLKAQINKMKLDDDVKNNRLTKEQAEEQDALMAIANAAAFMKASQKAPQGRGATESPSSSTNGNLDAYNPNASSTPTFNVPSVAEESPIMLQGRRSTPPSVSSSLQHPELTDLSAGSAPGPTYVGIVPPAADPAGKQLSSEQRVGYDEKTPSKEGESRSPYSGVGVQGADAARELSQDDGLKTGGVSKYEVLSKILSSSLKKGAKKPGKGADEKASGGRSPDSISEAAPVASLATEARSPLQEKLETPGLFSGLFGDAEETGQTAGLRRSIAQLLGERDELLQTKYSYLGAIFFLTAFGLGLILCAVLLRRRSKSAAARNGESHNRKAS